MLLYMEPIDTLFFRDNRPFDAGTDTFAESVLPSPLTIYGAIGNCILGKNKTDVQSFLKGEVEDPLLGGYDDYLKDTKLRIKGIFFCRGGGKEGKEGVYLPPPANLFLTDYEKNWLALPSSGTNFKTDIKNPSIRPLALSEGKCEPVREYISLEDMRGRFLAGGDFMRLDTLPSEDFFVSEQRYGHRIERETSTVDEGFLYSAAHIRFQEALENERYRKSKILVAIQNLGNLSLDNVIYLGGERKEVKLTSEDRELDFNDKTTLDKMKNSGRFFVYLLTPAIFDGGWCKEKWPDEFDGANLVGAAVSKPMYLSGWKRSTAAEGSPRPVKKAAVAGSVYFFETRGWSSERFENLYAAYNFNRSLSDEYPCAGFGISLIGSWKEGKNGS